MRVRWDNGIRWAMVRTVCRRQGHDKNDEFCIINDDELYEK